MPIMSRTISVMVGKGSVSHNSRAFNAANTDPARSYLNRCYCNDDISQVYHDLFSAALSRYNDKQTRTDRKITDYYEKIRSGKQEKPFHEVILQIGNREDMASDSLDGELARAVLDEYMCSFPQRNPNMRVFSAHLHMDEATRTCISTSCRLLRAVSADWIPECPSNRLSPHRASQAAPEQKPSGRSG